MVDVYYESVGVMAGQTAEGVDIVGILLLPCGETLPDVDYDEVVMTIPAAKAMLVNLQDAINAAIEHKE